MSLDYEEELQLQAEIQRTELEYLNEIKEDLKTILHESLMDTVFSYNPIEYNRTGQLEDINNIDYKIDNGNLLVYINVDNLTYYSNENRNTPIGGEQVAHFLEVGHDISGDYSRNGNSSYNYWDNYPAQHFLELAQERIQSKYPDLIVTIVRDQPSNY